MNRPEPVTIRPSAAGDLVPVETIERASFSDPWPLALLRAELIPDASRICLVAERRGEIVGYLMSWPIGERLHVLNIAVDPSVRRRGVGSQLLLAAAVAAAHLRLADVTLEVRRSNAAARGFYRRFGFQERGLRLGYYPNNGEDAVVMSCPVARLLAGREPDSGPPAG